MCVCVQTSVPSVRWRWGSDSDGDVTDGSGGWEPGATTAQLIGRRWCPQRTETTQAADVTNTRHGLRQGQVSLLTYCHWFTYWLWCLTTSFTRHLTAEYRAYVLVYKCLHQAARTHLAELCSPIVVTSVQLLGVTLQYHATEQWDTAKDVLLFLVQHSGIHSHCLFVIHHWHWLSSVCVWRPCYSAEHTKH